MTAYSGLDRLLHELAFGGVEMQKSMAESEDRRNADALTEIENPAPVFIAGLPRAGTTQLLESVYESGRFACHTYRHMPYLLAPLTWRRFAQKFWKEAEPKERPHGDGMLVSYDSPEAFEEAIWRAFWPKRYKGAVIEPWPADSGVVNREFKSFFEQHMKKLVLMERETSPTAERYVSKNNGNIARLNLIASLFPEARLVVPYRNPESQAVSLHRQHTHFSEIHRQDKFARRYMEMTGHYDFGANLKPINFGGWLDDRDIRPESLDFWMDYWSEAYGSLLASAPPQTRFVSYDSLCERPEKTLTTLFDHIGLDPGAATKAAQRWTRKTSGAAAPFSADSRDRAAAVWDELQRRSKP